MNEAQRIEHALPAIITWYTSNRRTLPWREDPTPYHIWISEIMLQQTRIEAVIPYYKRFLQELPDVAALSAVPEDRLIVSSIPFDAGWRVKINGQRQPLKMVHESVLGFILPAGADGAEISYRPYGFDAGLILTGIAFLLLPVVFLIERKQEHERK